MQLDSEKNTSNDVELLDLLCRGETLGSFLNNVENEIFKWLSIVDDKCKKLEFKSRFWDPCWRMPVESSSPLSQLWLTKLTCGNTFAASQLPLVHRQRDVCTRWNQKRRVPSGQLFKIPHTAIYLTMNLKSIRVNKCAARNVKLSMWLRRHGNNYISLWDCWKRKALNTLIILALALTVLVNIEKMVKFLVLWMINDFFLLL